MMCDNLFSMSSEDMFTYMFIKWLEVNTIGFNEALMERKKYEIICNKIFETNSIVRTSDRILLNTLISKKENQNV